MNFKEIDYYFTYAIDCAHQASKQNEVPVGAVLVDRAGKIISKTFNTKEYELNACNHAELLAISQASQYQRSWRLNEHKLFVTLEPCVMCMGAIIQSRISEVYFGAYDPKGGAISLGFNIHSHPKLNHKVSVYGGFKHRECSKLLSDFFKAKRNKYLKA